MKGFTTFVPSDTIASGQPPGVDPPWRLRPTFGCVPNTVLSSCSKTRRVTNASLNQLVGAGEERRWHSNAKRLGGFHIDDQLETRWLLDR